MKTKSTESTTPAITTPATPTATRRGILASLLAGLAGLLGSRLAAGGEVKVGSKPKSDASVKSPSILSMQQWAYETGWHDPSGDSDRFVKARESLACEMPTTRIIWHYSHKELPKPICFVNGGPVYPIVMGLAFEKGSKKPCMGLSRIKFNGTKWIYHSDGSEVSLKVAVWGEMEYVGDVVFDDVQP